jgi:hydrogenase nickel incorporation protein HypA/HybF
MHELAVCQGLIRQVERIARQEGATQVDSIKLSIGPLSGVEPPLLERAFEIARMGTVAQRAELEIGTGPIVVECRTCGSSGEASVNRLLCPACGDWRVSVRQGEEMTLMRVELSGIPETQAAAEQM